MLFLAYAFVSQVRFSWSREGSIMLNSKVWLNSGIFQMSSVLFGKRFHKAWSSLGKRKSRNWKERHDHSNNARKYSRTEAHRFADWKVPKEARKMDRKRFKQRHIIVKFQNAKNKEKFLKVSEKTTTNSNRNKQFYLKKNSKSRPEFS